MWQGDKIAAMIFTTTEYAATLQDMAQTRRAAARAVLNINPQWSLKGQVVSDFGLGTQARARKEFVERFALVFHQSSVSVFGDRVAMLRAYPGRWHMFYCKPSSPAVLMGADAKQPTFARLTELMQQQMGSRTSMSWLQRLREPLLPTSAVTGDAAATQAAAGEADSAAASQLPATGALRADLGENEAAGQGVAASSRTRQQHPRRKRADLYDRDGYGSSARRQPRGYGLGTVPSGREQRDELAVASAAGESVETAILRNQVSASALRIEQLTAERNDLLDEVRQLRRQLADVTGADGEGKDVPVSAEQAARQFNELLHERITAP